MQLGPRMSLFAVTGATGHLGRLAVSSLLDRGVAASDLVAVVRDPGRAADLADRGVQVRVADYGDPAALEAAFTGVDRLLFVSGSEAGSREVQHRNVVAAAEAAGVQRIVYTSIAKADTNSTPLAVEHRLTEQLLRDSGIDAVVLRNSWYIENYTGQLPVHLEHGIAGAAGDGAVSAATRADYAAAAAAVVATDGHAGAVYELGGTPFTMTELVEVVSAATGRTVTYTDLPVEQYQQVLVAAGLPAPVAAVFADGDRGVAAGELLVEGNDLARLLGREPTSLAEAVAVAVAGLRA